MYASSGPAKAREPENRDFSRRTQTSAKPTILIVEDHSDSREMLRTLLQLWGYRVEEACNGLDAVESALRERPALILMDGSLPFLDGLGATRRIRENRLLDEVKIVALNGWGSSSYNAAALAAGCDDCLVKPLDFELLRNCLVRFSLLFHAAAEQGTTETHHVRPMTRTSKGKKG